MEKKEDGFYDRRVREFETRRGAIRAGTLHRFSDRRCRTHAAIMCVAIACSALAVHAVHRAHFERHTCQIIDNHDGNSTMLVTLRLNGTVSPRIAFAFARSMHHMQILGTRLAGPHVVVGCVLEKRGLQFDDAWLSLSATVCISIACISVAVGVYVRCFATSQEEALRAVLDEELVFLGEQ